MNSDEVKKMMREAGVPDQAIVTTLPKESQQSLRDFIQNRLYIVPHGYRGIYVHPARPASAPKARKVFQVAAKEMLLSGVSAFCIPLPRLVTALASEEDGEDDYRRVESATMVFLLDFFERGATFPLQGWQAGVVRSWIKKKFEDGGGVSLLGDAAIPDANSWWPASFLGYLSEYTVTFPVE